MTIAQLSSWSSPNSVTIFAQPPGQAFVAFVLARAPLQLPNSVRLDLAETESLDRRFTITRNPTQRLTAQNRIREPDVLTVTGMLSAHPLLSPLTPAGLGRLDRVSMARLRLLSSSEPPTPLYVVTPERSYPNMMITAMREQYDENTGAGVALSITFEEIVIVIPGFVEPDLDALQLGAASASSAGATTPVDVVDPGGLG